MRKTRRKRGGDAARERHKQMFAADEEKRKERRTQNVKDTEYLAKLEAEQRAYDESDEGKAAIKIEKDLKTTLDQARITYNDAADAANIAYAKVVAANKKICITSSCNKKKKETIDKLTQIYKNTPEYKTALNAMSAREEAEQNWRKAVGINWGGRKSRKKRRRKSRKKRRRKSRKKRKTRRRRKR